jgi:hypothetical protein
MRQEGWNKMGETEDFYITDNLLCVCMPSKPMADPAHVAPVHLIFSMSHLPRQLTAVMPPQGSTLPCFLLETTAVEAKVNLSDSPSDLDSADSIEVQYA